MFHSHFCEETNGKKSYRRFKDAKEVENFGKLFLEWKSSCRVRSLKLALFMIACCTILSLLYAPMIHNDHLIQPSTRSEIRDFEWNSGRYVRDERYISNLDIEWGQIPGILSSLYDNVETPKIGLLNFNSTEAKYFKQAVQDADVSTIHLDHAGKNISWDVLYPEWIDEEARHEVPSCPALPEPQLDAGTTFNLLVVKLPCEKSKSWSRDVARLHLQLTAAKIAVASADRERAQVHVIFLTECFPLPNLFTCKHLIRHEGNAWLYRADIKSLQEKLQLPVGSCKVAISLEANVQSPADRPRREAYATILHSEDLYVCGAIAAANSIRLTGSTRDLVILVDESLSDRHRRGLHEAGWKVRTIQKIQNPKAKRDAYNRWNYSKFLLWKLTDYDKVIFVDADLLVLRNIDFLFSMPEISAVGNDAARFNSGVMVVKPSNCTFALLMDHINDITSYNGGDQGYLNEIFTWWHRTPKRTNFLKHFWVGDSEAMRAEKNEMYGADPPVIHVLHYLGVKPWLCYRDYDCNWNWQEYWKFASDAAHATWWRVHDTMPESLQKFCILRTRSKAILEYHRRKAERAGYADGHWKRNISDPRQRICSERFCSWESMLSHWGDKRNVSSKTKGKPV